MGVPPGVSGMEYEASTVVCLAGLGLVAAMTVWCVARVHHWRRIADAAQNRLEAAGLTDTRTFGRCQAVDVHDGDLVFIWAYVLGLGEWKHGLVDRVEHDRLDTLDVQLVRIFFTEGASFSVKPFAPAWILPTPS
jgi:hypothetical protein